MSDPKEEPNNTDPEPAPPANTDAPVEPRPERPIWPAGMLQSEASEWKVDSDKDAEELNE